MKVLVTGAGGQLGGELLRTAPADVAVVALTRAELDISDSAAVSDAIRREQPEVVINAAAWTAVDRAESEAAAAARINDAGVGHLASAMERGRLLHVSTDFVFDGVARGAWRPGDATGPLSVYGRTKLAGEAHVVALGERGLVVRASWVYSVHGANFVKTMIDLMRARPELRVVADQIGAPTWARGLAQALWHAARDPSVAGLHHWRDAGVASWYDFAVAISEEAAAIGLLPRAIPVSPIATSDYPTPARRPAFSLLDCAASWPLLGGPPPHWRVQLRAMLRELKEHRV